MGGPKQKSADEKDSLAQTQRPIVEEPKTFSEWIGAWLHRAREAKMKELMPVLGISDRTRLVDAAEVAMKFKGLTNMQVHLLFTQWAEVSKNNQDLAGVTFRDYAQTLATNTRALKEEVAQAKEDAYYRPGHGAFTQPYSWAIVPKDAAEEERAPQMRRILSIGVDFIQAAKKDEELARALLVFEAYNTARQ